MPGGPGIVSVGIDGDIDVWAVGSGVLPTEDELSTETAFLLRGQSFSTDQPLLALQLEDPWVESSGEAILVDATSGDPAEPSQSHNLGEDWFDQHHSALPGGETLVHGADGHVAVHAEGAARPTEYDLEVDEADDLFGPPRTVEGDLLVQSTGNSIDIVNARSGERRLSTAEVDDTYCTVGASQGATRVVAVTCGSVRKSSSTSGAISTPSDRRASCHWRTPTPMPLLSPMTAGSWRSPSQWGLWQFCGMVSGSNHPS